MQDEKMKCLTDCLSRYFWDSFTVQWALNNFVISLFVYRHLDVEARQQGQLILNILSGALQLLSLLMLFSV